MEGVQYSKHGNHNNDKEWNARWSGIRPRKKEIKVVWVMALGAQVLLPCLKSTSKALT